MYEYRGWNSYCDIATYLPWYSCDDIIKCVKYIRKINWSSKEQRANGFSRLNNMRDTCPFSKTIRFPEKGIFICEGFGGWARNLSQLKLSLNFIENTEDVKAKDLQVYKYSNDANVAIMTIFEQFTRLEHVYDRSAIEQRLNLVCIPPEVYLAELKEGDVAKIDSVWPHRSSVSKIYLKELITSNGGFGLYLKSDNTLCSWVMRNNYGGLAILQTDENHKRKNYASILSKHFAKYWAEKGLDNFCFIMKHNNPSQVLFEKLGWKKEHDITWIYCTNKDQ